jgi:cyclophilin family peptidyl-prolyl cis-trans isomerase
MSIDKVWTLLLLGVMSFAIVSYTFTKEVDDMTNQTRTTPTPNPVVLIKTSMGDIKAELYADKAPETVKNVLQYVKDGHYNHTIFHRVIDGFMIQGGGFTKDFQQKTTRTPIQNEADNGLLNKRGTLAMARTSDVNSATSQFFINVVDNPFLDFHGKNPRDYGYCVFGRVIDGMGVVDKIKSVKTGSRSPYEDVPLETVEIIEIKQLS